MSDARLFAALAVRTATLTPADVFSRASDCVAGLRRVVDCAGVALSRWNRVGRRHERLASVGYPADAVRTITEDLPTDPAFRSLTVGVDPVPIAQQPTSGSAVLQKMHRRHGYRSGLLLPLPDGLGRYTGLLVISCRDRLHPNDCELALVALLGTDLGRLCAPEAAIGDLRTVRLSDRERDVLRLLAVGRRNAEIAAQLHVGPRTVSTHVEHLLAKLELPNRTAAAAWAARVGLLDDPDAPVELTAALAGSGAAEPAPGANQPNP